MFRQEGSSLSSLKGGFQGDLSPPPLQHPHPHPPNFQPGIIIENILSWLPVESILECKCICKAWKTLIEDPFFLTTTRPLFLATFTTRQSFFILENSHQGSWGVYYGEYRRNASDQKGSFKVTKPINNSPHKWFNEDIGAVWNFIGSFNGLICLSACLPVPGNEKFTYTIYIYNPMIKEYVNLGPETFAAPSNGGGYRAMGFGYHPSTNEYKVIRINYPSGQVKVYTLGGNRWRDKGELPYQLSSLCQPGVLVNGGLHWLTYDREIVCFDLAAEEFRNVTVPPCIVLSKHHSLGVLGGRLCVYEEKNVWVKEDYMMDESWTKIFSWDVFNESFKEEDDVMRSWGSTVFVSNLSGRRRNVVSYYSESGSFSIVSDNFEWFNKYSRLDIVSYTKSFVSLIALGEKEVGKMIFQPIEK